jgi:hypothetical protein
MTGPNYQKYGEQAGWIYNPWTDKYDQDPRAKESYYQSQGLERDPETGAWGTPRPQPKQPSLSDQMVPIAATVGTTILAQEGVKRGVDALFPAEPVWNSPAPIPGTSNMMMTNSSGGYQVIDATGNVLSSSAASGTPSMAGASAAQSGGAGGLTAASGGMPQPQLPVGSTQVTAQVPQVGPDGGLMPAAQNPAAPGYGDVGSNLNYLGPVAMAAGAYGMKGAYESGDELGGALSGAGFGGGVAGTAALMGSALPELTVLGTTLGPVGWAMMAGALVGGALGMFGGHKTTKQRQAERKQALYNDLQEAGYSSEQISRIMPGLQTNTAPPSKEEAMKRYGVSEDFQGYTPDGQWLNLKFGDSRNESDLAPVDIIGYPGLQQYLMENGLIDNTMTPMQILEAQFNFAEQAVGAGAIREHHGMIDIDGAKMAGYEGAPTGQAWNEFKYNTSKQSVLEQVEMGNAPNIEAEIQRRQQMEPEWTDWDKIREELGDNG